MRLPAALLAAVHETARVIHLGAMSVRVALDALVRVEITSRIVPTAVAVAQALDARAGRAIAERLPAAARRTVDAAHAAHATHAAHTGHAASTARAATDRARAGRSAIVRARGAIALTAFSGGSVALP